MSNLGLVIAQYRKNKKLSQPDLAAELEKYGIQIKYKSISSWEKGGSIPSSIQLFALCQILDITDIYGTFIGSSPSYPFSMLNADGKLKAEEYIRLLLASGIYNREPDNVIAFRQPAERPIKLYNLPASAGSGQFLDGDDFVEIMVGDEVPETADFGIHLSGDSMQPQFVDGQVVWVHQQPTLHSGEIGIFFLDGNAYCKKYKEDNDGISLISLNRKYEDVKVMDGDVFMIFGKVVR